METKEVDFSEVLNAIKDEKGVPTFWKFEMYSFS